MLKLSDCTVANIRGLAARSIDSSVPGFRRATTEELAITVAHRLAHLIARLETNTPGTPEGAKWYLANVDIVPIDDYRHVIQPFIDRLTASLRSYEQTHWIVSTETLDRLIEYSNYSVARVLAGEGSSGHTYGNQNPTKRLNQFISQFMWRQGLFD